VSVYEIEQKDLDHRPILLLVIVFDELDLKLLDSTQPIRKLQQDEYLEEVED